MSSLLGALVVFTGYGILAYGWGQLRGGTAGLKNVVFPGQWQGLNGESTGAGGGATVYGGPGSPGYGGVPGQNSGGVAAGTVNSRGGKDA